MWVVLAAAVQPLPPLKKYIDRSRKIPRLIAIARISILRVEGEWDLHICDRANIMITVTAATNRQCWVGM